MEKKGDSKSQGRKLKSFTGDQNPIFITKVTGKRKSDLRLPANVVKDYNLRFNNSIMLIYSIGRLKREVAKWRDNRVVIKGFASILKRNYAKPNDKLVCEIITEMKALSDSSLSTEPEFSGNLESVQLSYSIAKDKILKFRNRSVQEQEKQLLNLLQTVMKVKHKSS